MKHKFLCLLFVFIAIPLPFFSQAKYSKENFEAQVVAVNNSFPFLMCVEGVFCGDWAIIEIRNKTTKQKSLAVLRIDYLLQDRKKAALITNNSNNLKLKAAKTNDTFLIEQYQKFIQSGEGKTISEQNDNSVDITEKIKSPLWRKFIDAIELPYGQSLPQYKADLKDIKIVKK